MLIAISIALIGLASVSADFPSWATSSRSALTKLDRGAPVWKLLARQLAAWISDCSRLCIIITADGDDEFRIPFPSLALAYSIPVPASCICCIRHYCSVPIHPSTRPSIRPRPTYTRSGCSSAYIPPAAAQNHTPTTASRTPHQRQAPPSASCTRRKSSRRPGLSCS